MEKKNKEILQKILDNPHLLGQFVNKEKLTDIHGYWIKFCFYPLEYFTTNNNYQLKLMLDFFNSLGKTIDIVTEDKKIIRVYLTEEKLLELLSSKKRSLKGHRGSYKTTAVTVIGSIVRLLFMPNERICFVQKDFTKASLLLTTIRDMFKIKYIKYIFKLAHGVEPYANIHRDNILTFNFKKTLTPEGNVNAFGVHQNMIGKHFDLIIADDFITLDDKTSRTEREKTKLHIEEINNNILDPGKQMIFTGTVWHKDDAWSICPESIIFDWTITNIMSEQEKQEKLSGRTKLTKITLAANYLLTHIVSDEQMFKNAHWLRWNFHYKKKVYGHIDAKYSGNHTNGLCFMVEKDDGRFQAIGFCFHEHVDDRLDFIAEKYKRYFCCELICEENADKGYLAKELIKKGLNVKTYHEGMNKHVKIEKFGYPNWDNIDWCEDTDPEYISQIMDYEQGEEPDDCADNFSSLIKYKFVKDSTNMDRWKW